VYLTLGVVLCFRMYYFQQGADMSSRTYLPLSPKDHEHVLE